MVLLIWYEYYSTFLELSTGQPNKTHCTLAAHLYTLYMNYIWLLYRYTQFAYYISNHVKYYKIYVWNHKLHKTPSNTHTHEIRIQSRYRTWIAFTCWEPETAGTEVLIKCWSEKHTRWTEVYTFIGLHVFRIECTLKRNEIYVCDQLHMERR